MKALTQKLLTGLCAVGIAFAADPAPKANAIVGIMSAPAFGIPLAVAGGLLMAAGTVTVSGPWRRHRRVVIVSPPLFIAGVILLDGEEGAPIAFRSVPGQMAAEIGMTEEEQAAYNAQYEELNVIAEDVALRLAQSGDVSQEAAHKIWDEGLTGFSEVTRSAVRKLVDGQILEK